MSAEVTVSSQVAEVALQRNDASLGQLINAQQVAELPLNGRNFVQLALLGPGTVTGRAGSFLAQGPSSEVSYRGSMSVSAQGMRENANDWLYDGVDDNELTAGGVGILPNIDSIREFKVLTHNYLAQYGSRGGTTVLVSSKSGENTFHGYAVRVLPQRRPRRPQLLRRRPEAPVEPEHLRRLAGRADRQADKTFFFAGFQGNNIDEGLTTAAHGADGADAPGHLHRVVRRRAGADHLRPGDDPHRSGDRAARPRSLPEQHASRPTASTRSARRCSNLLPHPDLHRSARRQLPGQPGEDAERLSGRPAASTTTSATTTGSSAASASRRPTSTCRPACPTSAPPAASPATRPSRPRASTSRCRTRTCSGSNAVNQFTAGYNRVYNYITSFGYGSNKSRELGIPGANLGTDETSSLTRMTFQNFVGIGDRGFSPFQGGTDVYHYTDTLTMVKGNHTLNTGGTFRAMQLNLLGDTALAGQFAFTPFFTAGFNAAGALNGATGNSIASLLLGLPASGGRNDQLNGSVKGRRWKEFRGFIDDSWRVNNASP